MFCKLHFFVICCSWQRNLEQFTWKQSYSLWTSLHTSYEGFMSYYRSPGRRERHTKSFYVPTLRLLTTTLRRWPAEGGKLLPLEEFPSLCVAVVHLTALAKIQSLRLKEMPKQQKMTAAKKVPKSVKWVRARTKQKPLPLNLFSSFCPHESLVA